MIGCARPRTSALRLNSADESSSALDIAGPSGYSMLVITLMLAKTKLNESHAAQFAKPDSVITCLILEREMKWDHVRSLRNAFECHSLEP